MALGESLMLATALWKSRTPRVSWDQTPHHWTSVSPSLRPLIQLATPVSLREDGLGESDCGLGPGRGPGAQPESWEAHWQRDWLASACQWAPPGPHRGSWPSSSMAPPLARFTRAQVVLGDSGSSARPGPAARGLGRRPSRLGSRVRLGVPPGGPAGPLGAWGATAAAAACRRSPACWPATAARGQPVPNWRPGGSLGTLAGRRPVPFLRTMLAST